METLQVIQLIRKINENDHYNKNLTVILPSINKKIIMSEEGLKKLVPHLQNLDYRFDLIVYNYETDRARVWDKVMQEFIQGQKIGYLSVYVDSGDYAIQIPRVSHYPIVCMNISKCTAYLYNSEVHINKDYFNELNKVHDTSEFVKMWTLMLAEV